MICTGFCYKFNCCYAFWIYFQARYCLYCVFILSLLFCLPPAGPDDYVESTQEENEVIHILCDDNGTVEITISDSDGECVPPSPHRLSPMSAHRHLKLKNSVGEFCL